MRRVRDTYNGDLVLPVADGTESGVANLILIGIEQKAGRIASVMPQVWFPPIRPGKKASEDRADLRREVIMGWWHDNRMRMQMHTRARYLIAYGSTPALLRPNFKTGCPEWVIRNPLATYPAEDVTDRLLPEDVVTAFLKPYGWLRRHYPMVAAYANPTEDLNDHKQMVILEYVDSEDYQLVFAGADAQYQPGVANTWEGNFGPAVNLTPPLPNRAGVPLCVMPTRITLDRLQGEFDQAIAPYMKQARLSALEEHAVENDVFPDMYLVSRPGEQARFVNGGPFPGRSGEVNVVEGGEPRLLNHPPGYQTTPMIDRLERASRIVAGVPAEFGGESTTNIRTGRRGDSVLSAVVDHPIGEAQEVLAETLEVENRLAIKVSRAWFGNDSTTYHFTEGKRFKEGTYKPNEVFNESDHHVVTYPVAGADQNALVVGAGQRIGLRTMSRRSAAELDPMIDDPELEQDRITSEALNDAVLASIGNAASTGQLDPMIVSRVAELVTSGQAELAAALAIAQQEQQARQQAPAGPTGMEEMMATAAAEQTGAMAAVPQAPASLTNLQGLMQALRQTNTRNAGRQALGGSY